MKLHIPTLFWAQNLKTTRLLFVGKQVQKLLLFQNLIGCIHPYSSPHFVRTSSWLDWKTLFIKLRTDTFLSAKIGQRLEHFISVDNPDQILLLFQNLVGCFHSYSCPHINWTSSWLDWETHFLNRHTETFIGAKFYSDMSTFFVDKQD